MVYELNDREVNPEEERDDTLLQQEVAEIDPNLQGVPGTGTLTVDDGITPISAEEQGSQQTNILGKAFHNIKESFNPDKNGPPGQEEMWRDLTKIKSQFKRGSPEYAEAMNEWNLQYKGASTAELEANNKKYGGFYPGSNDAIGNLQNSFQGLSQLAATRLLAVPDLVMDAAGSLIPGMAAIDNKYDELTKLSRPEMQTIRKFLSVVIPTSAASSAFLKGVPKATRLQKLLGLTAIDVGITGLSDITDDPSITQSMVEMWPGTFGPGGTHELPEAIVTSDDTHPTIRKLIHMAEAGPFAIVGNALGYLMARGKPVMNWFNPKNKSAQNYKNIEIARQATNELQIKISEIDQILTTNPSSGDVKLLKERRKELVKQMGMTGDLNQYTDKRQISIEDQSEAAALAKESEIGEAFDPDVYPGVVNEGNIYNSIPEGSIAKNKFDTTLIKEGIVDEGLPSPLLTENTRRKGLRVSGVDSPARTTVLDIEMQSRASGDFDGQVGKIKRNMKAMDEAAERIFIDIMDAGSVERTKTIFQSERATQKIGSEFIKYVNDEQFAGMVRALRELHERYIGGEILRTSARFMDTTGREIQAAAQAAVQSPLVDVEKVNDLILGKIQYLVSEIAVNNYVSGIQLRLKELAWSSGSAAKRNADELVEGMLGEFKRVENTAHAKAKRWTTELKMVAQQHPEALKPLIHVWDRSNGDVDTLAKLSAYLGGEVSPLGYIVSPQKGKMNLFAKGVWGVAYNNMLSGRAPLNALKGNAFSIIAKPINSILGSTIMGTFDNFDEFKRSIYFYGSGLETSKRALADGWNIMKRVHKDPDDWISFLRKDFVDYDSSTFKILEDTIPFLESKGDYGTKYQIRFVQAVHSMQRMKALRYGMTGMAFVDGATNTFYNTWLSRLRSYEEAFLKSGGVVTKEALEMGEKINYAKHFDKNLLIKDKALESFTGEVKFNLDDSLSNAINKVTNSYPILKHVWTFPRTLSNSSKLLFSYGPIAAIPRLTKYGDTIWAQTDDDIAKALSRHGIPADDPNAYAIWKAIRNEYIGRIAFGTILGKGLWDYALSGAIHGSGHYNQSRRQRDIRYYGFKPSTAVIPGTNTRISFEGTPVEPILNFIGDLAMYSKDLSQPIHEDYMRKLSFFIAGNIDNPLSGTGDLVRFQKGVDENYVGAFAWRAASKHIPQVSAWGVLQDAIDSGLKDTHNDLLGYMQSNFPGLSENVPTMVDPFTNTPVGGYTSAWESWANAVSPIKFHHGNEKWRKKLRLLNYEGISRFNFRTVGKIETSAEERQWMMTWLGENYPLVKEIEAVFNKPVHKKIDGKVRAFIASGVNYKQLKFKPELIPIYKDLDEVFKRAHIAAEAAMYRYKPSYEQNSFRQAQMDDRLKRGDVDGAMRIGEISNKEQQELEQKKNILQMAK